MRIESSNIQLTSVHEKSEIHTVEERLNVWGEVPGDVEAAAGGTAGGNGGGTAHLRAGLDAELMRISLERQESLFASASEVRRASEEEETGKHRAVGHDRVHGKGHAYGMEKVHGEDADDMEITQGDTRLEIMRLLVEKLSGEKVHLYRPKEDTVGEGVAAGEGDGATVPAGETEGTERVGWGVAFDYEEISSESERTAFASSGAVQTKDGREIAFDVNLEMSRERIDVTRLRVRAGDAQVTDPLVINFNGNAAALTAEKIDFDLDADGTAESISFVRSGSGFLVLDRNGDGAVNDGSELFGPSTGDGFSELAAYDDDRNGWIDEADSVYDALGVWTRTADGIDVLSSLRQADVGAIYLTSAATPFELNNTENETDGLVRSTGVYLKESGAAGTVQQVDLVT